MKKRTSKHIKNQSDIDFLLGITSDDFTRTFMYENFSDFDFKGKNKFNPYDLLTVPPNSYGPPNKRNKNTFVTTVGLWVYNKFFIEENLFDLFGYINETITKKKYKQINSKIVTAVLEDRLPLDTLKSFITYTEFMMPFVSILSPNDSEEMLCISSNLENKKKKLLKDNKEMIEKGDITTSVAIEKELLDTAMDKLKDDPAMDSYNSGARVDIGNNFKNMYVMKGAVRDPITNEFKICTSNYIDGISSEEYHIFANSLAAGPYDRGIKTAIGGYWEKLFVSALQHIKILPPGTDCKTTKYLNIRLDNPSEYMYSYIVEGDKLVQLTSENMEKYRGKNIKLRFSSLCRAKNGICHACAGDLFNKLGVTNAGLALAIIPSKLKNFSMKSFHDSVPTLKDMDIERAFGFNGDKYIR